MRRIEIALVLSLILLHAWDVLNRLRGPPPLGPARAPTDDGRVPIERAGRGVVCAPRAQVAACPKMQRPMSAARRLVLGVALDLDHAGPADLIALPGVGVKLAERILAARPLPNRAALARVRGLGDRRAAAIAALLGLDGGRIYDICSMGSWATTSSGCDKPR
jgi:hypothetical protein